VIRQRMYLDTMTQIYSRTTKVFVDSKNSNNVIYVPLDKLADANRQHAAAATGASATAVPATGASAPAAAAAATQGSLQSDLQDGRNASASATSNAAVPAVQASSASDTSDSDPLRSRDAFRSRQREDDVQ
jgi:modulator of FtsH protease HflK